MSEQMMATEDGLSVAGWVLEANSELYDAMGALDAFGVIDQWPVHQSDRAGLMDEAQPCFLYVGADLDRGIEAGIWAMGLIVGPVETVTIEDDGFWIDEEIIGTAQSVVPVELKLLAAPISRADLQANPVLQSCELLTLPAQSSPTVLRLDELQAFGGFDLAIIEPTDEQLEALDAVSGPDFVLVMMDGDVRYAIADLLDGTDAWHLMRFDDPDSGDAVDLGSYANFDDAIESLVPIADEVGTRTPIFEFADDDESIAEPVAVVSLDDGSALSIVRVEADKFVTLQPDPDGGDPEEISVQPTLGRAIADVFADPSD
jgi:hypothetical protein